MPSLSGRILELIQANRWRLSWHANESIQERQVEIWQVIGLSGEGRLLREDTGARPRPKVEIELTLPDGTLAKAVWALDAQLDMAVLVTAHFFDRS